VLTDMWDERRRNVLAAEDSTRRYGLRKSFRR
jgi:hypothetical protein